MNGGLVRVLDTVTAVDADPCKASAPKGRINAAQGNALGNLAGQCQALKGRFIRRTGDEA
jgi:hypothetical protein